MDFNHTAVARYPKLGNGLKATRDLAPGDDIVRIDEPYLIVVEKAALNLVCSQCLHEKEKLQRCTGCKVVYYCSRACQSIAWRGGHKLECPIYQRLPDVLPTEVRGVMGLLLKKKFGLKPDLQWISLEGHAPALRRTGRWDDIVLQAKAAVEFSGSPARCIETAVELLCRMAANAFRVTLPEATETGLCFEPVLAMANHDCDPNAFVMFDGRKVFLRALNPIKQGEQIFISYIDTVLPRDTRLADLQASYFFTCTCHKCTSDLGTYTTFIRAFPPISYPRLDLFVDPKSLDLTHNLEPWADKVQQVWEFHIKNSFGPVSSFLFLLFTRDLIMRWLI
ncbi:hypothetical protein B0O99DRAFT_259171 [Bisporella sp. PMI_857]|nr:hypothetical protein B0O99DRAFT_259171 [Bisporella sp. PMI_857]